MQPGVIVYKALYNESLSIVFDITDVFADHIAFSRKKADNYRRNGEKHCTGAMCLHR